MPCRIQRDVPAMSFRNIGRTVTRVSGLEDHSFMGADHRRTSSCVSSRAVDHPVYSVILVVIGAIAVVRTYPAGGGRGIRVAVRIARLFGIVDKVRVGARFGSRFAVRNGVEHTCAQYPP